MVSEKSLLRFPEIPTNINFENAHISYGIVSYFQGVQNLIPEKEENQQLKDLLSEMSKTLYSMLTEQKRIFERKSGQKRTLEKKSDEKSKNLAPSNKENIITIHQNNAHPNGKKMQEKKIPNAFKSVYETLSLTFIKYIHHHPKNNLNTYYQDEATALSDMIYDNKNITWIDTETKVQIDTMLDTLDIPTEKSNDLSFPEKMEQTKNALIEIKGILLEKLYSYCESIQPKNDPVGGDHDGNTMQIQIPAQRLQINSLLDNIHQENLYNLNDLQIKILKTTVMQRKEELISLVSDQKNKGWISNENKASILLALKNIIFEDNIVRFKAQEQTKKTSCINQLNKVQRTLSGLLHAYIEKTER